MLLLLFFCLCGAFFQPMIPILFPFSHISSAYSTWLGALAFYPAKAGYIDHILRAVIGDLQLRDWLWIRSRQLFIGFLQDRLSYRSCYFFHLCCQCRRWFCLLRDRRLWRDYYGCWAWCGYFLVHRVLPRHSGPQGETGGNCCGYGNLFFHSGSSSDAKRAPALLVWQEAERSFSSFCSSIESLHASSKPAIKLSREACSVI